MARRDTAKLAMMSDPERNKWFSCAWVLPPPLKRKRRPAGPDAANFESTLSNIVDTAPLTKAQARALAERLFAQDAGMNRVVRWRATALEREWGA